MNIEIKNKLKKYWFNIKEQYIEWLSSLLKSIKWRNIKYWEISLSRKETKKFWLSERQLNNFIQKALEKWLLKYKYKKLVWNIWKWFKKYCNIYDLSNEFIELLSLISWWIEKLNNKIIKFNKKSDIYDVLSWLWLKLNYKRRKINWTKITYSKKWAITNWKTDEHFNLFNFIKNYLWLSTYSLANKLKL